MALKSFSTCDPCKKLRLRCDWIPSSSFIPKCSRCDKYGLNCLINDQTWSASAQQIYRATVVEASSRTTFWGPASNSAGHPIDLHGPDKLPAYTTGPRRQSTTHSRASVDPNVLDLDPNVKNHLFDIYFSHIQRFFPVVSRYSLQKYPPTPLLEAVICGVAAKHRLAIASWRDLEYTRNFIREQLARVFSLRAEYEPKLQTVQALLIACGRFELLNQDYTDTLNLPITTTLMCKMAQDLRLDRSLLMNNDTEDIKLQQQLWKASMFMDAFKAATFGQTLNIHQDYWIRLDRSLLQRRETESLPPSDTAFDDFMVLGCHLQKILRSLYSSQRVEAEKLLGQVTSLLHLLQRCQTLVSSHLQLYDTDTARALQMYVHNNRLLVVLGAKMSKLSTSDGSQAASELRALVERQYELVVQEAIQTLTWLNKDVIHSPFTEMGFVLYFTSRALLVVVGQINSPRSTASSSPESVQLHSRLVAATESARAFSDMLLGLNRWGVEWYQAYTIRGILRHINKSRLGSPSPAMVRDETEQTQSVENTYIEQQPTWAADPLLAEGASETAEWDALVESCGFDTWFLPDLDNTS